MASNHNPSSMLGRLQKVRAGLTTKLPQGRETIDLQGVPTPVATIVGRINEFIGIFQNADDAHETLTIKVKARTTAEPVVVDYLGDVQTGVSAVLGRKNPTLKSFGFPPKKGAKKLSGKALAAKADKSAQTRDRNHTLGKRQKKALKEKAAGQPSASNGGVSQGTEPTNGGTQPTSPTPTK